MHAGPVSMAVNERLHAALAHQRLYRRIGYVQKRGHNERFNYSYVTAADIAGSVGDLLAELGVVPAQEGGVHVMQQTGAGILPVKIRFKDGRPQRVTMTQKDAAFKASKIDKKKLAASLGLKTGDLHAKLNPEFVSTGIYNLLVPLKNRAALSKIQMNMLDLARLFGKEAALAYCFTVGPNHTVYARAMAPWGLYEDAGTGSAAGSLGAYLVKHGRIGAGHTLNITQGVEMGRPCYIEVEVTQSGKKLTPRVSGAAVKVFEGVIRT